MRHLPRAAMVLALSALCAGSAHAQSHAMNMMHRGVPSRVAANQRVGPYVATLWIEPEVGDGTVYVMLDAADGRPFTPPSAVRVAAAPASRRIGEVVYEARLEPAGARGTPRYVTHLAFDRAELWTVRVIVNGPAGGGEIVSQVESTTNAAFGLLGVVLASMPFVLVAFVYWRSRLARRRVAARLLPAPRLTPSPLD